MNSWVKTPRTSGVGEAIHHKSIASPQDHAPSPRTSETDQNVKHQIITVYMIKSKQEGIENSQKIQDTRKKSERKKWKRERKTPFWAKKSSNKNTVTEIKNPLDSKK